MYEVKATDSVAADDVMLYVASFAAAVAVAVAAVVVVAVYVAGCVCVSLVTLLLLLLLLSAMSLMSAGDAVVAFLLIGVCCSCC